MTLLAALGLEPYTANGSPTAAARRSPERGANDGGGSLHHDDPHPPAGRLATVGTITAHSSRPNGSRHLGGLPRWSNWQPGSVGLNGHETLQVSSPSNQRARC